MKNLKEIFNNSIKKYDSGVIIEKIKAFLRYNNNGIESAIEQYLHDMLR